MSKMIETMTKQVIRNEILEILEEAIEVGVSDKVLSLALKSTTEVGADTIQDALSYLCKKGLVEKRSYENARLGIGKNIYFITADGIDVLDGIKKVEGLGD